MPIVVTPVRSCVRQLTTRTGSGAGTGREIGQLTEIRTPGTPDTRGNRCFAPAAGARWSVGNEEVTHVRLRNGSQRQRGALRGAVRLAVAAVRPAHDRRGPGGGPERSPGLRLPRLRGPGGAGVRRPSGHRDRAHAVGAPDDPEHVRRRRPGVLRAAYVAAGAMRPGRTRHDLS